MLVSLGKRVTEFQTVLYEKAENGVATITINRPEAFNSFNFKMVQEFGALWSQIAHDDDVHAVVLRAAPGRAFCPGVDVKNSADVLGSENIWTKADPGEGLGPKMNKCWKPVIAAVHGICAGGAFYWINECDIVICEEGAQFFDPHVTYGMASALEPIGAVYKMPLGDVLRMALLGNDERICAQTALRIGLVTEVLPLDRLWDHAHDLASKIAAKPPAAIQGTVRAIWESLDMPRSAALNAGLKYPLLANPVGESQVDRWAIMSKTKDFAIR
jgi:enoyl-CoA hydratase/carnithine racemase